MATRKTTAQTADSKTDDKTKDTPGSATKTDTAGKASPDPKTKGTGSGEKGAAEDAQRQDAIDAGLERAAKAAVENGVSAPVVVVASRDRLDVIGDEYRDVTHDADYEPDEDNPDTLQQHELFRFDQEAKTKRVDHIAVASNAAGLVLEVDGTYYEFDVQLAGALRRLVTAGSTNLNL